eukprot:scaffold672_cov126-Cylindrotheca_fusiformis.AAC.59
MSEQEASSDDFSGLGSFFFYSFIVHPCTAWILRPGRFERRKSIYYAIAFLAGLAAIKTVSLRTSTNQMGSSKSVAYDKPWSICIEVQSFLPPWLTVDYRINPPRVMEEMHQLCKISTATVCPPDSAPHFSADFMCFLFLKPY